MRISEKKANRAGPDPRIYKFLTSHAYKKAAESLTFEDKLAMIEQAIAAKQKLEMTYLKANDTKSKRVIVPLTVSEEDYRGKKFPGMLAYGNRGVRACEHGW